MKKQKRLTRFLGQNDRGVSLGMLGDGGDECARGALTGGVVVNGLDGHDVGPGRGPHEAGRLGRLGRLAARLQRERDQLGAVVGQQDLTIRIRIHNRLFQIVFFL